MRLRHIMRAAAFAAATLTTIGLAANPDVARNSAGSNAPGSNTDLARHVNPFIGTGGHGHTFPGAIVPFGMIQPSPDTRIDGWDACSGYYYADSLINGISHTHLSGTGCCDYGDILLMPTVGEQAVKGQCDTLQNLPFASPFSHAEERAEPGYYSVMLKRYGVLSETTATERAAIHRFTYPADTRGDAGMIIDMDAALNRQYTYDMQLRAVSDTEIEGYKCTGYWAGRQGVYFTLKFSEPFTMTTYADSLTSLRDGDRYPVLKAMLRFPGIKPGGKLLAKIGISAVDHEGARANLAAEIPGFDFDGTRAAARTKWNGWLSKMSVPATEDSDDLAKFYTALYHAAVAPNLFTDTDGRYYGMDRRIHRTDSTQPVYTVFSTWDTFRALHPLLTIIDPGLNDRFLNTLLLKAREGGILPMWELAGNYTGTMIGYHTAAMFADAVAKKQNTFDVREALSASRRTAEYDTAGLRLNKWLMRCLMPETKRWKCAQGWAPADKDNESVAKALEYAYDDWAIARLAEAAGDEETRVVYDSLAKAYRHYWDPDTRFMRGRMSDYSFRTPFNPYSSDHRNDDYCEGNAWQWSWFVPHDVEGLKELLGGNDKFIERLDTLFTADSRLEGANVTPDISGMIGQYAHGNEPSHHIVHLYNYAGQPRKTQELVGRIFREQYRNDPDGLSGNEDCGQMSAWLLMNAMGIYQVAPGNPTYSIGRPLFSEMTVSLPDSASIHIAAPGLKEGKQYVKRVLVDGRLLSEPFITHDELIKAREIYFDMEDGETAAAPAEPADYVNPFVGTANYGTTNPGAIVPNGMMSVSPFNVMGSALNRYDKDSRWWSTPYDIRNSYLTGFSHVNLSGVGCPDMGSLLLMATSGPLNVDYRDYGTSVSTQNASPGHYSARFDRYGIIADATATARVGVTRYTFPPGEANILLNLGEGLTNESGATVRRVSEREFEGMKLLGSFCYNPGAVFPIYFVMRADTVPTESGFWKKQREMGVESNWDADAGKYKLYTNYGRPLAGDDIGVWMKWNDVPDGFRVTVRMGVSFTSIENARDNLDREAEGRDFDTLRADARRQWNGLLGRVTTEGGTEKDRQLLYTSLYHTLVHPNLLSDVSGDYPVMESDSVSNISKSVSGQERYTVFSLWDTYRNLHQLLTLLYPDRQEKMVNSMLDIYREHGWLPKWELYGRETLTMEGDPAIPVIVDTWSKGLRDFDIDLAYEAMKKGADTPGPRNKLRPDNDDYLRLGYVPLREKYDNSVSHALEYYIADHALSAIADSLGHKEDARRYAARARGYRHYYSPETGTLRPRLPDGKFLSPFNPRQGENFEDCPGFHEGSAWNYTFYVPHDIPGLTRLMGGQKKFLARLQGVFDNGLYDPANEPDIAYPYIFSKFPGEEWRTQELVTELLDRHYTLAPDGIPGNEDTGTMSAWAVFAMLGLYPDIPGDPGYTVTTPRFDRITLRLDPRYYPRDTLTIEIENPESESNRIESVTLLSPEGKEIRKIKDFRIGHNELTASGYLRIRKRP